MMLSRSTRVAFGFRNRLSILSITTDTPDMGPIFGYSPNESLRKRLQEVSSNRAWPENEAPLRRLLENLLQLQVLAGPFGAQTAAIPLSALCAACKWGLAAWFALRIGRRVVSKLGV